MEKNSLYKAGYLLKKGVIHILDDALLSRNSFEDWQLSLSLTRLPIFF